MVRGLARYIEAYCMLPEELQKEVFTFDNLRVSITSISVSGKIERFFVSRWPIQIQSIQSFGLCIYFHVLRVALDRSSRAQGQSWEAKFQDVYWWQILHQWLICRWER